VVGEGARLGEGEQERRPRRHGVIEGAPVGGHGVRDACCLLVQETFWPIFTFKVAGEKAGLSMATAVPLAVVPAPLLL
jgi:hypothetical protein